MAVQRKLHTAEFKLQAVKRIAEQTFSVAEVARRLGVSESLLHTWKKAFREHGEEAFPGHGKLTATEDELRRLKAENTRLKAERDLLKKAAAYFANPPS
jgi:transposase